MRDPSMIKAVQEILTRDRRYWPDSYLFVLDALEFTTKLLPEKAPPLKLRHVGGRDLLEGIRLYAIQEFGPMALRVLSTWGIKRTEDFGEIVFNLIETGKLRKTEQDTRADFAAGYDFTEAFAVPFLPKSRPSASKHPTRAPRQTGEGPKRKGSSVEPPPPA